MIPTRTFDLLDHTRGQFPKKNILAEKTGSQWNFYTTDQYHEIAHLFACGLLEMDFQQGDKIVTITHNRPQWNFVDMGMALAGVVHVPVYTSMNRDEYKHILTHSDASMLILSDRKLLDTLEPLFQSIPGLRYIYTFDPQPGIPHWWEIVEIGKKGGRQTLERLEEIKKGIAPGDLASIIYTSGTTGTSKGVMLSHENLIRNALEAASVFQLTPEDRYLSIIPVCHVGGRMGNYQTQYAGACIYYAENMGSIATNLKEIRATGFDAVPRILEKIFDNVMARGRSLSGMKKRLFFWAVALGLRYEPFGMNGWIYTQKLKLADRLIFSKWREALGGEARLVGCGGATLQPRLEKIFWAAGLKIINMYGLTETSPIITINRQEKAHCRLGTVGKTIKGVDLKIAADGEVYCRGHNIMLGYYKDPELTGQVIDAEGWFHTGDVGHLDDGGFLVITDRKKEIFKLSNGKYIAPQPIENKLKESPFIDQVMVLGEHQKFATALVVPDFSYLRGWCESQRVLNGHDNHALICVPEVISVFQKEIESVNQTLSEWEQISRIRIVPDEWSPATGELSASLKLKRKVVEEKYKEILDAVYKRQ
jgi:long-chain acyl-CoA synthetase